MLELPKPQSCGTIGAKLRKSYTGVYQQPSKGEVTMSKLHSSEEMLRIAGEVAKMLLDPQMAVAQVGLIGSLARREDNPGDIDLVVLTTNQGLTERLLKKAEEEEEEGHQYPSSWRRGMWSLGAGVDLIRKTAAALDREQLHIVILPSVPTDEYLNRFEAVNSDPDFLEHTARDFQRYDPERGEFTPSRAPWQDYLDEQGAGERSEASTEVFTLTRPRFGRRQVRTLGGLSRGLVLTDSWRGMIVVLGSPYEEGNEKKGAYGYDYATRGKSGWYRSSAYCPDVSVLPYEDGRWNTANCLLRTGLRRLPEEEIRAIEDTLSAGDKSGPAGQFISEYVCG